MIHGWLLWQNFALFMVLSTYAITCTHERKTYLSHILHLLYSLHLILSHPHTHISPIPSILIPLSYHTLILPFHLFLSHTLSILSYFIHSSYHIPLIYLNPKIQISNFINPLSYFLYSLFTLSIPVPLF